MHLIIPTTPQAHWDRLLPLFDAAGHRLAQEVAGYEVQSSLPRTGREAGFPLDEESIRKLRRDLGAREESALIPLPTFVDAEALLETIDGLDQVAVVGLYSDPVPFLARTLTQGGKADAALTNWRKSATALVDVFREARQHIRIFNADEVAAYPDEFCRACNEHFGLSLAAGDVPIRSPLLEDTDPLRMALATSWVSETPKLTDLLLTIEACATPLGEPAKASALSVNPDAAHERMLELESYRDDAHRLNAREEEHQSVLKEMFRLQEALESNKRELDAKENQQEKLATQLKGLEKKLQDVRRDRDRIKKTLNGIKKSRSWKLTAPLRSMRRPGRRSKHSEETRN